MRRLIGERSRDYCLAALLAAAAATVRAAFPGPLANTPFLAFYPAVAIAAMRGWGPGVIATVISASCYALWFVPDTHGFHFGIMTDWLRLGIFLAGGAGVSLIGHRQRLAQDGERQRAEELRRSEAEKSRQKDLLAVTLRSIGDGVIVTDPRGNVTFLNSEAERLTGWPSAEATGRPLSDVFHIINEHTRQVVESPAEKVLRLGTVVALANHTILLRRDGAEIPIDDSGAPIRQPGGEVEGVVLVFRDFSAQKKAELALRQSEQRVRLKLESILSPEGDLGDLELADLIDVAAIQSLMERFYELVQIPMAIIDLKGKVLVGVGWQEICTHFHRANPESCRHCIESDVELTASVPPGECKLYKCKNHMWDMSTPIIVGGQRVGNLFTGQFFFDDEPVPRELFQEQAKVYGFEPQKYLAALDAVPRLSHKTIDTGMSFFMKLAHMISLLSYSNIKLARSLQENDRQKRTLRALSNSSQAMLRATSESQYLSEACRIIVEDCGHSMVWIGYAEDDENRSVRPVAHAGIEEGYLQTLNITWADTPRGRGPTGTAIRTGRPSGCRNMLTDPAFAPWREEATRRGYASSLVLPLLTGDKAFGALMIYAPKPDAFTPEQVSLLSELAGDLAYGISAIRLREAQAKSQQSLRDTLQRVELLAKTTEELLCSREPQKAAQMLCERAMQHLDCHAFFNFLVDPRAGRLRLNAFAGVSVEEAREIESLDYGVAVCGCAARDACRIVAEHIPTSTDPRIELVRSYGIKAYACHPLLGPAGRVLGTLSFGTRTRETFSDADLSLMKAVSDHVATAMMRLHAEQELVAARRSAEQARNAAELATKAKNDFLAVLSHELRTPLSPVLATVTMLQRDLGPSAHTPRREDGQPRQFDADLRQGLEVIHRNVEMEARLIDDLLDVTRIERGKVELHKQQHELATIIQHAVEVCRPDIEKQQLECAIDLKDAACTVYADAARLQQVFWNLFKNAIKFTPSMGQLSILCRRENPQQVTVVVNDNGVGIDPGALPHIFDAFEQAGRQTTRQFGGLGLGLTISKAMVELHGGTIHAHSDGRGRGATFTVRLPVADAPLPSAPLNQLQPSTQPPSAPPQRRHLRILLVEDHDDTANIMRLLLVRAGHQVMAAADIATALKLADQGPFDLLLSDLGLPDGSGLDLMRTLRQRGVMLPGIALSGYGQETDLQASRAAGFHIHLVKPVQLPKLEEAIADAMAHR